MADDDPPRVPTELEALRQRVQDVEDRLDGLAPTAPCGKISRRFPMTISAQLAMASKYLKASSAVRKQTFHRVCIAPLGHRGEWHRSEDCQVWHDVDCRTVEQVNAEDEELRRQRDAFTDVVLKSQEPLMAACEICWERAAADARFRGGYTVDRYRERIAAEELAPTHEPETLDDRRARGDA